MNDNRLKILKMLEEGKINAEEAYKLLSSSNEKKARHLIIRVKEEGGENVNVKIPLNLAKTITKVVGNIKGIIPEETQKKLKEKGVEISDVLEGLSDLIPEEPTTLIEVNSDDESVYIGVE